jgi:broad specificity phosphatase PhoE
VASDDPDGRVLLLRHGETEWSASGRHTGRTDVPLTERGRARARATAATGARLLGDRPPALVLSSPRTRARSTAELAGLHVDRIDERLVEWDYGDYEGLTTPQIREDDPGWTVWTHPSPGGETAAQVQARADGLLADVAPVLTDGDVVLVGHGHFSRVLIARWIGLPATEGVRFAMDSASWAVLGHERGVPRCDHVNLSDLT